MQNLELPKGNGQRIYVDPEQLYINPNWINKKEHYIAMPNIPTKENNPVYEAYKNLFDSFRELNYKVITEIDDTSDDMFFFTPCLDKERNKIKRDYVKNKSNKIFSCLEKEGIFEPLSISFPEDSFPKDLPPLPLVLKNERAQGGAEKFLIKTPDQLKILKKFYEEINQYVKEKAIESAKKDWFFPYLEFDENGISNKGIRIDFIDYKKEFHKNIRFQKFVKTPTIYNTSLRVLTSSSGDVFASSLKYSETSTETYEKYYGLFDRYLSDPSSPYFLGNESIVSNTFAGGNSILLGKDAYSKEEEKILRAHNITSDVPNDVLKASLSVATNCKREIGAVCGLDFIYDEEEGAWKYLEEHEYPMLFSYAKKIWVSL